MALPPCRKEGPVEFFLDKRSPIWYTASRMEPFTFCYKAFIEVYHFIFGEYADAVSGGFFAFLSYLSGILVTGFQGREFRKDEKRFYGILFSIPCLGFAWLAAYYFWFK